MDYLANKNAHPRDANIVFDEGPHIYTINGNSDFMSVTTWNHSHFAHFDPDSVIDKMMASNKWAQSKYFGKTREEIKTEWEETGNLARDEGTKMHHNIECFYNGVAVDEASRNTTEYKYFQDFVKDYSHLTAFRTEWMIYDEELKLAGSIDMVFQTPEGTLEIYDWKRAKEIKRYNPFQNGITECVEHLPDCNFYHYSLQLNTYKAILERNYGVKINGLYLICLHPNNENGSYIRIPCKDMTNEINCLFEYRKQMLDDSEKNNVSSTPNQQEITILEDIQAPNTQEEVGDIQVANIREEVVEDVQSEERPIKKRFIILPDNDD